MLYLLLLRDRIGDHHSFEAGIVDACDGWAREDAMCQDGVHLGGPCRNEPIGRESSTMLHLTGYIVRVLLKIIQLGALLKVSLSCLGSILFMSCPVLNELTTGGK